MDAIGVHGIFRRLYPGVFMPRGLFVTELKKKVEPLAVVLLLPMFFTYFGAEHADGHGQFGLAAADRAGHPGRIDRRQVRRLLSGGTACGEDNRTAMGIGALMNSRGLMELIIINIGLQKGIIGPTLFSMLVLMAIVTTMMASPLFEYVYGRKARVLGEMETLNGGKV